MRHRALRWLVIVLAVVLVVAGGAAGYAYYLAHNIKRVNVAGLHAPLTAGAEAGSENILMVGSTSRCALAVQNPAYGLCSQGVTGVNGDVIMVLHVNPATRKLALLSIPRDLFIPNARAGGANKIDAGLYEGLSQMVASIEEDFGIPIQHAVSLNFDQFANIVNALGGINMSFPDSVFDKFSGLNVQAATCVHLNGTQALQVVRARHLQYKTPTSGPYAAYWPQQALSDIARIQRDHEFLRVLASSVAKQGLGNPITDLHLVSSLESDLTFDQSWSVSAMANLVREFHSVNINSAPQLTLPVQVVTDPAGSGGQLVYRGGVYGDVEFPSTTQDLATIDQVLGVAAGTDTMTGQALPAPSSVSVSVLNGTGAYNQATDTADALAALGFHTVGVGDTTPTGDVSETVVYYGSRAAGAEAAAEAVLHDLSGSAIMAYNPRRVVDGAQVTVVTGSQFAVSAPSAVGGGSSSAGNGTSSSTGGGTSPSGASGGSSSGASGGSTSTDTAPSGSIAPPTSNNIPLSSYDPRACPAGATPTAPVPNPVY